MGRHFRRPGPVWVYLHLDVDLNVLYVGQTNNKIGRLRSHEQMSSWFGQIRHVQYVGPFAQDEVDLAERHWIGWTDPAHNALWGSRHAETCARTGLAHHVASQRRKGSIGALYGEQAVA